MLIVSLLGCGAAPPSDDGGIDVSRVVATTSGDGVPRDYLFVIDGSYSMTDHVEALRTGLLALQDERPFAEGSRVGVIAAQSKTLGLTGHAFDVPGVGRLVARDDIASWRAGHPHRRRVLKSAGCEGWFAPYALADDGQSCIVANSDFVGITDPDEAGLTGLAELLQNPDVEFRADVPLEVVFISDAADRRALRDHLDFDALEALAAARGIDDLGLNAIVPAKGRTCGEPFREQNYLEAVRDAGGVFLELCGAERDDYTQFVRNVAGVHGPSDAPRSAAEPAADVVRSSPVRSASAVVRSSPTARAATGPSGGGSAASAPTAVAPAATPSRYVFVLPDRDVDAATERVRALYRDLARRGVTEDRVAFALATDVRTRFDAFVQRQVDAGAFASTGRVEVIVLSDGDATVIEDVAIGGEPLSVRVHAIVPTLDGDAADVVTDLGGSVLAAGADESDRDAFYAAIAR